MWKLLTGVLADNLYSHLEDKDILPVEQKDAEKEAEVLKTNFSLIR